MSTWLALVDGNHTHHRAASHYWNEQSGTQTAFCRVSMLGFLRLGTQPRVLSRTLSHQEAWNIYRRYLALPEVCFLAEPADTDLHFARLTLSDAMLHRLWTDAHLAAFAITARCRLVSFDRDFQRFPGLDFLHLNALPQP